MDKVMFSVGEYDYEGDCTDDSIFLHIDRLRLTIGNELEFDRFINRLISMRKEIWENLQIDFEEFKPIQGDTK